MSTNVSLYIFCTSIIQLKKDRISDPPLRRRRVAKKTTISKGPSSNIINQNPVVHQRTCISTNDKTFDELNHYTPSLRQQSQSIIPINNNEEIGLSRISDRPLLPTSSNPEPVMNELIREAANLYMHDYPQLTHGVEYKKIGIALITEFLVWHVKIQ
ncbi:unnamed protein product [Rotaria sp. Silwood2]|nr:unnamed protein product [Rotaria sp. Silwood2]